MVLFSSCGICQTALLAVLIQAQSCAGLSSSNRVFVAGLSPTFTSQLLEESFARYGTINDVSVIGLDDGIRKRKPYAFVTFESSESAASAVSSSQTTDLYQEVMMSEPIDKSKRKRNSARVQEESDRAEMIEICQKTNLLLQVQSTHLDRLIEFIGLMKSDHSDLVFRVEGSSRAVRRNMSLLFLSACDPTEMARRIFQYPILSRALKKAYVVDKGALEANLAEEAGCEKVVKALTSSIHLQNQNVNEFDRTYRIHSFPPSHQSQILSAIETAKEDPTMNENRIILDPRQFTDIISIVQAYEHKGNKGKGKDLYNGGLVMAGVSPTFIPAVTDSGIDDSDDAVCRAYYKLKEAIDRYTKEHPDIDSRMFQESVALDCGSAPGGWTKYLADDLKCSLVYSVDPGELEIDLDNVEHMQIKIQDAMPLLKGKGSKIKIWVSDMCLHEMEGQLDFLLLAKENGILEESTFFVLTLKCTTGRSKANHDSQVAKVLESFSSRAETTGMSTYHLFSNRSGERTIMGFLQ